MSVGPIARLACNACCFIYPAYASYKALTLPNTGPRGQAQGPSHVTGANGVPPQGLGDETIERWLMYWSVVGVWTAVETTVGWTFTWLPFYSVFKLFSFLYFALPQTQGSSFVYNRYLAPAFAEHEADIDAALGNLRSQATSSLTDALGYVWKVVQQQLNGGTAPPNQPQPYSLSSNPSSSHPDAGQHTQYPAPSAPPPTFQDPAAGAARQLYTFIGRYAGQYLPVAATALQAAAQAAAGSRPLSDRQAREMVGEVQEVLSMPVPVPTPGTGNGSGSRTMGFAQGQGQGQTSARGSASSTYAEGMDARMRNVSSSSFTSAHSSSGSGPGLQRVPSSLQPGMPGLAHHDSHGSSHSSSSSFSGLGYGVPPQGAPRASTSTASGGNGQHAAGHCWGGDMSSYESISHADAPAGVDGSPQRPEGRRTSSWFSRGRDEREKTE